MECISKKAGCLMKKEREFADYLHKQGFVEFYHAWIEKYKKTRIYEVNRLCWTKNN